jgi:NADH:ubiquinone oxidoreductase subunit 3 (subunit A)
MWTIQVAFRLLISCRIFLCSIYNLSIITGEISKSVLGAACLKKQGNVMCLLFNSRLMELSRLSSARYHNCYWRRLCIPMRYTCGIKRKGKEAGYTRVRFYVLILIFDYKEEYQ